MFGNFKGVGCMFVAWVFAAHLKMMTDHSCTIFVVYLSPTAEQRHTHSRMRVVNLNGKLFNKIALQNVPIEVFRFDTFASTNDLQSFWFAPSDQTISHVVE